MLVVDDEPSILRALRINLTARNYQVSTASDGASGLAVMARDRPDVMILDLGLPDMDGTEVIRGVRGWASTPIIVLSVWGHESQKVAALDAGADDYVTKPFGMDELLARLRAAIRRSSPAPRRTGREDRRLHRDLNLTAKRVTRADGGAVRLTPTEWQLLEILVRNRGRLVTQRQLLQEAADVAPELTLWGPGVRPGRLPRGDHQAGWAAYAAPRVHHGGPGCWGAAARCAGSRLARRSPHHHEVRPRPRQPGPARDLHCRRLSRWCRPVRTAATPPGRTAAARRRRASRKLGRYFGCRTRA